MKPFNLEEYLKNPSRKVITRDGRKVTRILCTDAKGKYPIIALIWIHGEERVYSFTKNGCWSKPGEESVNDLYFAPEKHEGWINVHREIYMGTHAGPIFNSKEEAERSVREDSLKEKPLSSYLTTVKIEWEE